MSEIVLFHHAQGLTPGVRAFATALQDAGHTVHLPDSYDGHTFDTLDAGIGYAREVGFGTVGERAVSAAGPLPGDVVYIGISLGVMAAQQLAQHKPGARGAVLLASCVPPEEFGTPWPDAVPVQVHGMEADPIFAEEGDLDAARALVAAVPDGELFLYPGDQHLFMDQSLAGYDEKATALLLERTLAFLGRVG